MVQRSVFQKAQFNYRGTVISNCTDSRRLWRRRLKPAFTPVSEHSAYDFSTHFARKVDGIRAKTMYAVAPIIKHRDVPQLERFDEATSDEVLSVLRWRNWMWLNLIYNSSKWLSSYRPSSEISMSGRLVNLQCTITSPGRLQHAFNTFAGYVNFVELLARQQCNESCQHWCRPDLTTATLCWPRPAIIFAGTVAAGFFHAASDRHWSSRWWSLERWWSCIGCWSRTGSRTNYASSCTLQCWANARTISGDVVAPLSLIPERNRLRTAACGLYDFPRTMTVFAERALAVADQQQWNTLLSYIRNTTDRAAFKRVLKINYFKSAYNIVRWLSAAFILIYIFYFIFYFISHSSCT